MKTFKMSKTKILILLVLVIPIGISFFSQLITHYNEADYTMRVKFIPIVLKDATRVEIGVDGFKGELWTVADGTVDINDCTTTLLESNDEFIRYKICFDNEDTHEESFLLLNLKDNGVYQEGFANGAYYIISSPDDTKMGSGLWEKYLVRTHYVTLTK